jgi:hypothetical protein
MEKINAREWVAAICDTVEDMLSEYDIKIPDEERNGEENEARLYGRSYDIVADSVQNILQQLVDEIKANPTAEYDFDLY